MKRKINLILVFLILLIGTNVIYAQFEYTGNELRDPFKSYLPKTEIGKTRATVSRELGKLHLTGVIWGGKMPLAIINDKIYRVGESILGIKIIEINKTGVLLKYKEETYILKPK